MGALQFGVLGVLGARLAWLQVAQGPRYKTLSDKNRINIKMLPPSRGEIVDRFGTKLAVNEQNFRLQVIPEQTQNLEQSLRAAAKLIKIDEKDIKATIAKAKRSPKFVPVEIKDNLSWEDVAKIEVNLTDLAGLSIQTGEIRNYPYGDSTAHIVGYVSAVSRAEVKKNPVLNLPGFKTGKTGVEKTYDDDLRGHAGASEVEVNVVGREVRELGRKPSVSGDQITLTIDGELQKFVQERINQERSASAIIMDVKTGAVYALASGPSFDPNLFTKGLLSAEKWEELLANPGHPHQQSHCRAIPPPPHSKWSRRWPRLNPVTRHATPAFIALVIMILAETVFTAGNGQGMVRWMWSMHWRNLAMSISMTSPKTWALSVSRIWRASLGLAPALILKLPKSAPALCRTRIGKWDILANTGARGRQL